MVVEYALTDSNSFAGSLTGWSTCACVLASRGVSRGVPLRPCAGLRVPPHRISLDVPPGRLIVGFVRSVLCTPYCGVPTVVSHPLPPGYSERHTLDSRVTRNLPDPDALVYCRTEKDILTVKSELAACLNESSDRLRTGSVDADVVSTAIDCLRATGRHVTPDRSHGILVDVHGSSRNFEEGVELLRERSVDHLFVPATASPEIEALVETAIEERTICHVVPGPWSNGTVGMSDVMLKRAGPGEEWSGRPPLGYEVESGHLVPAEEFEDVVATLRLVNRGKLSKRSAADELDTSRRTITRCLETPNRYLLND